ncbi:MAG TPA: VOC family protein [Acidimicrobiales bacterium]|jgi:catechol 2,3-dioxygenase-like lactoylglutathione lyase family enzyme|nr:VOC family protein [Acidimicrobiales bacterium]
MAVELNHTIVACTDKDRSARFLAEMFGLGEPETFGPFRVVEVANGVSFDFDVRDGIVPQHYAFLVTEDEFDQVLGRIEERGLDHWADPGRSRPGINHNDGGRGVYFQDPDGHLLEALTVPYGGWR